MEKGSTPGTRSNSCLRWCGTRSAILWFGTTLAVWCWLQQEAGDNYTVSEWKRRTCWLWATESRLSIRELCFVHNSDYSQCVLNRFGTILTSMTRSCTKGVARRYISPKRARRSGAYRCSPLGAPKRVLDIPVCLQAARVFHCARAPMFSQQAWVYFYNRYVLHSEDGWGRTGV